MIARLVFSQLAGQLGLTLKALALLGLVAVTGYAGCRVGQATTPSGVLGRIVTRAVGGHEKPERAPILPKSGIVPPSAKVGALTHRDTVQCLPVEVLVSGPERTVTVGVPGVPGARLEPLSWDAAQGSLGAPSDGKARLGLVGHLRAWAARKSAERAARRVESLFPGQLDLDSEYLLAAGEFPPSNRHYRVGAKIAKTGGAATLIYDSYRPWLAVGGLRRAWIEVGPRWAPGGDPLSFQYGLGFMADGLRVSRLPFGAYATVDRDATTGELSGQVKAIVALDFSPPK
jgi:hypothetical protein